MSRFSVDKFMTRKPFHSVLFVPLEQFWWFRFLTFLGGFFLFAFISYIVVLISVKYAWIGWSYLAYLLIIVLLGMYYRREPPHPPHPPHPPYIFYGRDLGPDDDWPPVRLMLPPGGLIAGNAAPIPVEDQEAVPRQ